MALEKTLVEEIEEKEQEKQEKEEEKQEDEKKEPALKLKRKTQKKTKLEKSIEVLSNGFLAAAEKEAKTMIEIEHMRQKERLEHEICLRELENERRREERQHKLLLLNVLSQNRNQVPLQDVSFGQQICITNMAVQVSCSNLQVVLITQMELLVHIINYSWYAVVTMLCCMLFASLKLPDTFMRIYWKA